MKKVILNGSFGGYGWSKRGVIAVLNKKGVSDLHYFLGNRLGGFGSPPSEVGYAEFMDDRSDFDWFIRTKSGNPVEELDAITDDEDFEDAMNTIYASVYDGHGFDREDEDAISVLEDLGKEYCSGRYASLYIEEYDDEYFDWGIDEYDGSESLDLIPNLTEERILACTTVPEVLKLLKKCGVIRRTRK